MKGPIIGFIIGVLLVPLSTLGLIFRWAEIVLKPLVAVPAWVVNLLLDTANTNGAINMITLTLVSGLFYAAIGFIIEKLIPRLGGRQPSPRTAHPRSHPRKSREHQ